MRLKVEYIPIDALKPYDKNAKIHTPEQVEQIKKSITDFGMNDPKEYKKYTILKAYLEEV